MDLGCDFWRTDCGLKREVRRQNPLREQKVDFFVCCLDRNCYGWETHFLPLLVLTRRGRSTSKKPVLVILFLENTRDLPEIITSTGATFLCDSALQYWHW